MAWLKHLMSKSLSEPVLQTSRLILRPPTMSDFPRWAEMMADAEAARFLGGVQPAEVTWRGFMAKAWSCSPLASGS